MADVYINYYLVLWSIITRCVNITHGIEWFHDFTPFFKTLNIGMVYHQQFQHNMFYKIGIFIIYIRIYRDRVII